MGTYFGSCVVIGRRSAYFEGQIEQPVRGLTSLITYQDLPVLVAINAKGVYIIDDTQCVSTTFFFVCLYY